jgi:hypothetical protein
MNKDPKMKKITRLTVIFVVLCVILAALLVLLFTLEPREKENPVPVTTEPTVESSATQLETTETTAPEAGTTVETEPALNVPEPGSITYAEYLALSVEIQQAYYHKFESPEAFFQWLDAAKKAHEAAEETDPGVDDGEDPTEGTIFIEDEEVEDW